MITITGPLKNTIGDLVSGIVSIRPYPFSETDHKGTAKIIDTTLVDGREIRVSFENGEPVETLELFEGTYEVRAPLTKTQLIAVPEGSTTKAIAELVTSGAVNPPSIEVGLPSGGTAGQHLTKVDETDFNTQWTDPAGASFLGSYTVAMLPSATLGQSAYATDAVNPADWSTGAFVVYDGAQWVFASHQSIAATSNIMAVAFALFDAGKLKSSHTGNAFVQLASENGIRKVNDNGVSMGAGYKGGTMPFRTYNPSTNFSGAFEINPPFDPDGTNNLELYGSDQIALFRYENAFASESSSFTSICLTPDALSYVYPSKGLSITTFGNPSGLATLNRYLYVGDTNTQSSFAYGPIDGTSRQASVLSVGLHFKDGANPSLWVDGVEVWNQSKDYLFNGVPLRACMWIQNGTVQAGEAWIHEMAHLVIN